MLELPPGEARQPAGRPQTPALPRLRLIPGLVAGASSGALTALAFPPADLGPLAFIAMVPLAIHFRKASLRHAAVAGGSFGIVFFGLLVWWVRLFGWAAFVSLICLQAAWVALALAAGTLLRDRLPATVRFVSFPIAFVAGEYLRAHLPFTGFTWGGLGYSQHDAIHLLRLAPVTGVWGLSFLIALVAAMVGEGVSGTSYPPKPPRRLIWIGSAALVALAPAAIPVSVPGGPAARIAIVQGNAPEGPDAGDDFSILISHARLSRRLGPGLQLVVWPEGAAGSDPLDTPELANPLLDAVRGAGVPFLVGARNEIDAFHFRNEALLLDGEGRLKGRYDKTRLVPFGEFVPARALLTPIFKQLESVPKDGVSGRRLTVFHLPQGEFASIICFESTFPDLAASFVRRGARFLVVITDNSSFGRTAASRQHLAFSQLRAAENRMWIAHAALAGISGVVAPDGRILQHTELFEPATLTIKMRFATTTTFYARTGDWLPIVCILILGAFVAAALWSVARLVFPARASIPPRSLKP